MHAWGPRSSTARPKAFNGGWIATSLVAAAQATRDRVAASWHKYHTCGFLTPPLRTDIKPLKDPNMWQICHIDHWHVSSGRSVAYWHKPCLPDRHRQPAALTSPQVEIGCLEGHLRGVPPVPTRWPSFFQHSRMSAHPRRARSSRKRDCDRQPSCSSCSFGSSGFLRLRRFRGSTPAASVQVRWRYARSRGPT